MKQIIMPSVIRRILRKASNAIPRFLESPCLAFGDQCCSLEFYSSSFVTTKKAPNNKSRLTPEKN